jgi:nitrous oxide reductase
MKDQPENRAHALKRRSVVGTAAAAGAAVAATAWLAPTTQQAVPANAPSPSAEEVTKGGGYRLSEHVKHYYRTARI